MPSTKEMDANSKRETGQGSPPPPLPSCFSLAFSFACVENRARAVNSLFDLLLFEQFQTLLLYVNLQAASKERNARAV